MHILIGQSLTTWLLCIFWSHYFDYIIITDGSSDLQ